MKTIKTSLFLLLIITTQTLQSQNSFFRFGGGTHWSIGKNFIWIDGESSSHYLKPVISYNFQALAELKISSSLSIQSGIIFDNWRGKSILNVEEIDPTIHTKYKNTWSTLSIGIPVRFLFILGNGKIRSLFQAGGSAYYAFAGRGRQYTNNGNGYSLSDKSSYSATQMGRNFLLNAESGLGMEFTATSTSIIRVMPFFEFQASNYFSVSIIQGHRWRTGLAISFLTGK